MIAGAFFELVRLRRNQWLDTATLERIQFEKLGKLLRHAYANVPYYRRLFDSVGIKPDDIASLDDLQRIPITTKDQLQSLPTDQIVAHGAQLERCLERRTSGSTGMPLTVYVTPEEKLCQTLISLRILFENGLRFSDKLAYVGDPRHFASQNRWFQRLGILRRINVSIFDDLEDQVRILRESKPDALYGYPSSLVLLAGTLKRAEIPFPLPRLIFTTAELLTSQNRHLVESVFGQTHDVYGTVEFGDIAWKCARHEGYHVNVDCLIVEVLREGRRAEPETPGELVCTSLYSYAMPLIRYRVGDVCAMSAARCSCGRGLPLMKVIEGRADDFVRLADGQTVSPRVLTNALKHVNGIKQYSVIEEEPGVLLVCIVAAERLSVEIAGEVEVRLREAFKDNVEVKVQFVDEIPRDSSGKVRSIMSRVR